MTNTQNVTELQPRMTREQLIDAARTAAKYLPVASAQLMTELANRLDYTSVALCEAMSQRKSLAAENAGLKEAIDATIGWQQSTDSENVESVRMLVDVKTPVTDAFLAEVRAQGVESAGEYLKQYAQGLHEEARLVLQDASELCNGFAAQLRKGVQS